MNSMDCADGAREGSLTCFESAVLRAMADSSFTAELIAEIERTSAAEVRAALSRALSVIRHPASVPEMFSESEREAASMLASRFAAATAP